MRLNRPGSTTSDVRQMTPADFSSGCLFSLSIFFLVQGDGPSSLHNTHTHTHTNDTHLSVVVVYFDQTHLFPNIFRNIRGRVEDLEPVERIFRFQSLVHQFQIQDLELDKSDLQKRVENSCFASCRGEAEFQIESFEFKWGLCSTSLTARRSRKRVFHWSPETWTLINNWNLP